MFKVGDKLIFTDNRYRRGCFGNTIAEGEIVTVTATDDDSHGEYQMIYINNLPESGTLAMRFKKVTPKLQMTFEF